MSELVHEVARNYLDNGISVIPIKDSEDEAEKKKSKGAWKQYTERLMKESEIPKQFNGSGRIAIVSGEVSGNLECIDVDDVNCWQPLKAMIEARHPDMLDRLVFTQTPNGFGIVYRNECKVPGNAKLSKAWIEVEGPGEFTFNDRPKKYKSREIDGKWVITPTKIETRGEGGYFLTEPTPEYEILKGTYEGLKAIPESVRNSLMILSKSFDDTPAEHRPDLETKVEVDSRKKIPWPGDIFNREADIEEMLLDFGWARIQKTSKGVTYGRPGGEPGKESAILYPDGRFHVFSSNADPLQEERQYTAFALLTFYKFDGDFSESTKHVVEMGYHVELDPEELKEILKDNPDQLEEAYNRSGMSEAEVSAVATELGMSLPPGKRQGRIEVLYDKLELNRVVKETDTAMSSVIGEWGYFKYSGRLGYVTEENTFQGYDKDTLELRAEQSMYMTQWEASGKKGKMKLKPVRVHEHVLRKLLTYPDSSAHKIRGFAQHPIIDQTGEVIGLQDGFENGIMFSKCSGLNIKVDDRSFKECYDRIVELFCGDILFKNREVGQALFVSMMMTALCRLGIEGGCPGYFITANEPGTGKSTMFEFVSRTVYGHSVESVDWGEDTVERRKEIISVLREGVECLLFDNITQGEEVKSPILAQALAAGQFKNRILGKSESVKIQAQSLFVFIGNNLKMSTELARRLMTIDLISPRENPATRDVKVNDIPEYCEVHRGEVIGCLLKMVQESFNMSKEIDKSSGFTFWDRMVRNPVLVQTGIDIAKGFEVSQEGSEENMEVTSLITQLTSVFGVGPGNYFTTKQAFLAVAEDRFLNDKELVEAGRIRKGIEDECEQLKETMIFINARSTASLKSTGKVLSELTDRVTGDYRFVRHATRSKKPVRHWIEYVPEEDEEDEEGDS